jgi:hypothetical protein
VSYSEFLKSLVATDGAFVRFERQRAQLAFERAALEKEKGELAKRMRFTMPYAKWHYFVVISFSEMLETCCALPN